ncbi:hypothetical protein QBC46DRAFT_161229 [Diplogelasinospora grovesii]|uniref:DOMON domain-containing protein n=1 Tax=Diplogelasinospora grovesii TaxID=303347 RepID=A0AAN6S2I0_9PEZI|nr:hypothetical protein QBC46DRAFT_161229 [Diplogelasinospora grovesii]
MMAPRLSWRFTQSYALVFLLLQITTLTTADNSSSSGNVSSLYIPDSQTQFAINLPPDSDDVNIYLTSPDWYSYTAIGFGDGMAGSLMFVAYPASDGTHVTVSPRIGTGDTEPPYTPTVAVTVHDGSSIQNDMIVANFTCHSCRSWSGGGALDLTDIAQAMIFALGPNLPITSDDPAASLRRHIGYGHFTMNMPQATGGGIFNVPANITTGAAVAAIGGGDGIQNDNDKAATAHGILFALIALAVAPFDLLVAGTLKRWPVVHAVTSTVYTAFVIGAFTQGVVVSREYIKTQGMTTGHQVLGLITVAALFASYIYGFALGWIRHSAKKRQMPPPEKSKLLGEIHTWVGRLIWLLLIINNGLGLQLAQQRSTFIIGYAVLAAGVVIFVLPIYFCIWRCTRPRKHKEEDASTQLADLYNHDYH